MGAKPKTANWWGRNKTIVLVTAIGMVLVIVAIFAFYQSQRPNYRDLEREFQSLNIPANWKLESNSSNKGFLGLACFQIAGEQCPYIVTDYLVPESRNRADIEETFAKISSTNSESKLLEDDGYGSKCSDSDIEAGNYYCRRVYDQGGIYLKIILLSDNPALHQSQIIFTRNL